MFKIESYVTPLILSYVDKYIKNIKPEDSQVSLWGGDAVFHNLDLRLDVLEAELRSPFTFSSGHIHELRIHVPWTKLASESIVITINTIECTLKLKSTEDRSSEKSSQSQKAKSKRQEVAVSPPGYIQSLMSKIVNNISIVCNNVILKYLEEDIVLSLNARTVSLTSANSKWETAFTDLAAPDFKSRKEVTVADLTICLDQCNAQGKIPTYQEPFLYRCSLTVRLCSTYSNASGAKALKTCIDCLFPKLDFSLSDQQIPMFLRIFNLGLALFLGDFKSKPNTKKEAVDSSTIDDDADEEEDNSGNQSWAGWAWGYVPAILPVWENETIDGGDVLPFDRERIVQFGMFVERVNWTFKWAEVIRDVSISSAPSRLRFQPFLTAHMQGCFCQVTLVGIEWVDVQGGISHLTLEPSSPYCLCGVPEETTLYYLQGCERADFLRHSLYDPNENLVELKPDCQWDDHVQRKTEAALLERTPALGFDYLYQLELPGEIASEYLSQLGSELEYSNLPEKALFRLAVSPLQLNISYGLCHRLSALWHAAHLYNYPDYADRQLELSRRSSSSPEADQLVTMGSSLPSRTYQVAILRPLIFISVNKPHPDFDLERLFERRTIRMKDSPYSGSDLTVPVLKLACTCADLQIIHPMYPIRLILALQALPSPPPALLEQGHTISQLQLQELSADLVMEEWPLPLVKPCNFSASLKLLLLPELWQTERAFSHWKVESEGLELMASQPQLDYIISVWKVLTNRATSATLTKGVSLEAFNTKSHPTLQLNVNGLRMDYIETESTVCAGTSVRSLNASIRQPNPVVFFSHLFDPHHLFVECLIQAPRGLFQKKVEADGIVPVFVFKLSSFDILLESGWFQWLNYHSGPFNESVLPVEPEEDTGSKQPVSYQSNQSNCARDSGLSSSMDGQTRRASSWQQLAATKSAEDISLHQRVDWVAIRRLLQRSILHVDVQPSSLVIPGDDSEELPKLRFQLPAVDVACPHMRTASLALDDLPFRDSESILSSFPWTVSFQNFGLSSGYQLDSLRPILEPVSLKMTIALNPSTAHNPTGRKSVDILPPSIDLCIHIDMNAIEISLDVQQLELLCNKFVDFSNWSGVSTSSSPSTAVSPSNLNFGLWLQWAMPRFLLALETPSSRTVLDMEDVTTSLDYQHHHYAKIKSRLTSVSVKLFTRLDKTWVLESKTNGIVLSCFDDITRDLLPSAVTGKRVAAPSIAATPPDVFQSPPASKSSVSGNAGGGILALTWTRARRQDVHSKWQSRSRRKSNQTEEEVEEVVMKCDSYLHEVDIAMEPIDIVVTEILLQHVVELAQPALGSLSRLVTSTSSLPASSHTLPLIFATSKGLRLFLVQERFLLLNLDGAELSPHVQNPIDRTAQLKPDLYDEAERQGLLFIPGHDVENRQYQIDTSGLSLSSGCWAEVSQASWVWRTLNPASTLHTMAENPALEWNARQEQPSEPRVGLTPILARCSFRVIYAPPIVSLEQQCVVAGQSFEISASSDVQLLMDVNQVDYYAQWVGIVHSAVTNLSTEGETPTTFPSHSFFTSNRVGVIIYASHPEEFVPFASMSFIQPHLLIKTDEHATKEVAVYDVRVQLPCWSDGCPVKSSLLPDEGMFPISLIETRAGQPSTITGVPPSLLRLEITCSRQLDIELGRPFKFILHADNVSNLRFIAQQLEHFQTKEEDTRPSLYRLIHLKTSQVIVEIPLTSAVVIAGFNQMALNANCQLNQDEEKREKMEANLTLNAFCIKADVGPDLNLQLCDPFSADCRVQLLWPHWLSDGRSLMYAFCRADNLRLHAGPRQISICQSLMQWLLDHSGPPSPKNDDPAPSKANIDKDEQHYQDDLRTGAFDFQVRDTTSQPASSSTWAQVDEKPSPYQVVFNVRPASMCWAYPQPRVLTRVDVYPIPLLKADTAGQDPVPGVEQVDCTLEFWDHCSQEFRVLRRFSLSETRFTRVPLANISTQTRQTGQNDEKKAERELLDNQMAFSDMWRIVMHFTEDNLPENRPKKIIAAPPSLVACTRIDSYFNASMVSNIQLGCTFNHFSLSLRNQVAIPPASLLDSPYHLDGTMPTDFPFATLNFSSVSVHLRCRLAETVTASLDVTSQVQANVINLRFLVDESILEPTSMDVKILLDGSECVTAFISSHRALDFNIGQCSVHTLTACLSSWSTFFRQESHSDLLYTHYVLLNDTQNILRIGQSGTGESILLTSRQAHQYAWKVMGEDNQLHACMEGGRWRWCQPCSIDRVGTSIRSVLESRPKLPLIWSVKAVNSIQKQVTIRGQIQVANLLPQALEVKLVPTKSEPSGAIVIEEMRGQIGGCSVAPSLVFPLEHLHAVKVRLPGNTWSGLIPVVQLEAKTRNVLLVRVAQKDKNESLNLWCHLWTEKVDHHQSRLLVLFSPLYMVRSYLPQPLRLHLRTPGLNSSVFSEIDGRGSQSVLECPGSVDHGHQLSFQLSSSLPESTPAVPLSWTMASQNVGSANPPSPFIDDLLEQLFTDHQVDKWPFAEDWDYIDLADIPQPKTDVRVTFSSLHRCCHTLLVELKPWALFVNQSGVDLVLKRVGDSAGCWTLANRAVMAPPPMNDDTFQIGVAKQGEAETVFYSQPLLLQDQDHFHFMYRPRVEGAIPLEGHCSVQIMTENSMACFVTLTSRMHDGIRILSIQPTFRIHNDTASVLKVACFIECDQVTWKETVLEPNKDASAVSLLFWQGGGKNSDHLFLSIRACSDWSCPIQLCHPGSRNANSYHFNPQRYSVSIPLAYECRQSEAVHNCPLVITRLEQNGLTYISMAVDSNPLWVLVNQTELTLAYAQASDSIPGQAESDCDPFNWHATIRPNRAAFYTPPWGQLRYVDVSPPTNLPRLLLALEETSPKWSHPVHPSHAYDQFLNLSPNVDVMVKILPTTTPNQTAIYIEPVSLVEISASDVRGRIELPQALPHSTVQDIPVEPLQPAPCLLDHTERDCQNLHDLAGHQFAAISNVVSDENEVNATVYWPEIGICFRDDTTVQRREVTRLTADHLLIDYLRNPRAHRIALRCGRIQMDNQMYQPQSNVPEAGNRPQDEEIQGFDFPVILLAQNSFTWLDKSLTKLLGTLRQNAFFVLELGLTKSGRPTSLDFRLDPVFLFVEDRFILTAIDYLNTFSFHSQTVRRKRNKSPGLVAFPDRVAEALSSLSVSVNLDQLTIRAISLDLSLRSSVKLYIALDHSPLRLDAFERSLVLTTPYKLGQTLAMHYVSSALFKAGWVVGSMELLGSPTALARTVTLGLKDFVRLPYQGMWRGPRGFLAGIFNGSASLVSHVTAGTVTSVTQLASSVARNVDRLSFDFDFQQRSEEGRRKKPQGLAQGIGWGLSALGLSLLGALGGLAHHPLQSLIEDGTVSPRGLAVGLTKGIVGVVAKPISGAADLVAQTGQGLLSATQWNEPFQARRPQLFGTNRLELICSGPGKILWKLNDEMPPLVGHQAKASRICCCLEAMRARVNDALPIREQLAPVILLVSTQTFCVLNAEDGEVQVVLDLNEVDCWAHETDPTVILVRPTPLTTPALVEPRRDDEFNPHYDYERVSEFVRVTTPYFLPEAAVETIQDAASVYQASSIATMDFFLNPTTKDFFIQCFQMAKQQRKGVGFPLI